jgi:hypothetical protein
MHHPLVFTLLGGIVHYTYPQIIAFLSNMRCSWANRANRALGKQGIGRVPYFPENRYSKGYYTWGFIIFN